MLSALLAVLVFLFPLQEQTIFLPIVAGKTTTRIEQVREFIDSTGLGQYQDTESSVRAFFSEQDVGKMTVEQKNYLAGLGVDLDLGKTVEPNDYTYLNCDYGRDANNQWYVTQNAMISDAWTWRYRWSDSLITEPYNLFVAPEAGILTSWFFQVNIFNAPLYNGWNTTGYVIHSGGRCL